MDNTTTTIRKSNTAILDGYKDDLTRHHIKRNHPHKDIKDDEDNQKTSKNPPSLHPGQSMGIYGENKTFEDKLNNFIYKIKHKPEIVYEENEKPLGITESDKYIIIEYNKPDKSKIVKYKTKKVYSEKDKTTILLKIAILDSGKTKVTSIWYPKDSKRGQDIIKNSKFGITESVDYLDEVMGLLSLLKIPAIRTKRLVGDTVRKIRNFAAKTSKNVKTRWHNLKNAK